MPKLTVSWDENGPLLHTAEVENPSTDRRWSAPVGQLTEVEKKEIMSATPVSFRGVTTLLHLRALSPDRRRSNF
jgi:hypothetical protein